MARWGGEGIYCGGLEKQNRGECIKYDSGSFVMGGSNWFQCSDVH